MEAWSCCLRAEDDLLWCIDVGWSGEQCEQELAGVRGRDCVVSVLGVHAVDVGCGRLKGEASRLEGAICIVAWTIMRNKPAIAKKKKEKKLQLGVNSCMLGVLAWERIGLLQLGFLLPWCKKMGLI